jgi:hypothetical protein
MNQQVRCAVSVRLILCATFTAGFARKQTDQGNAACADRLVMHESRLSAMQTALSVSSVQITKRRIASQSMVVSDFVAFGHSRQATAGEPRCAGSQRQRPVAESPAAIDRCL